MSSPIHWNRSPAMSGHSDRRTTEPSRSGRMPRGLLQALTQAPVYRIHARRPMVPLSVARDPISPLRRVTQQQTNAGAARASRLNDRQAARRENAEIRQNRAARMRCDLVPSSSSGAQSSCRHALLLRLWLLRANPLLCSGLPQSNCDRCERSCGADAVEGRAES